jgi:tRNA G18 (ribose-2'-O)-methylase SpoU
VIVYGRNPVREALRGRRRVQRVFASERAAEEVWLGGIETVIEEPWQLEERCGSPDHQGVCAEAGPYQYVDADSLLEPDDALVLALDEVQDPHNLGAVARVAEAAGCAGLVLPERRSAEVTPAVCRASAGAVEHLPIACGTSPTGSYRRRNARTCGCTARPRTRECHMTARTTAGGSCSCSEARAAGCARAWRRAATSWSRCRTGARSAR